MHRDELVGYDKILSLANGIYQTKAVNNSFYELWMSKQLNLQQLIIFSVNFYDHVSPTVDRIIKSFIRVKDIESRKNLIENISDEIGLHGKPHTELLRIFLNALLTKIANKEIDIDNLSRSVKTKETERLIEEGDTLFFHEDEEIGCGALLAQEWHAYPQLVKLYEGARNYMSLFGLEEFHEFCEYFYIHIGAAEKEHKIQSIFINAKIIKNNESFEKLKYGFDSYLNLLSKYWEALYQSIILVNKQHSKQFLELEIA